MTITSKTLAGLLLALFLVFALTLATTPQTMSGGARFVLALFSLGAIAGAAGTVTYRDPASVNGTTTAPTTAQVANCVIADVTMPDAATATTITHNLPGVSTTGTNGSPFIHIFCLTAGATPVGLGVTVSFLTNAVVLTPITTAAGNGCTYRVQIWRHSLITNYTI